MSHISKPVDWKVFNISPIQPVQYYSILKKKREFSQLIRQYDAQVFKHGYLHYCGIVPKNINSSLSNKYEILIVFFDEVPNTSFIGFTVKVSKETFIHESNSLLLFLKKSKKTVFYLMNNNCIHVHCGTNAWELFYLLYDEYLRQYVLTVIGTQFFYHFVYSYCIQKDIQLLEMLYKGSKIIRVSKMSIYYKIHRKRKISITDLIHMTLNMPKSKSCVESRFSSKESLLYSNFKDENFYTAVGNKINVSKLALRKYKKQFQNTLHDDAATNPIALEKMLAPSNSVYLHSKSYKSDEEILQATSSNTALKRKLEDIENDTQPSPSTSKFLKISDSSCTKGVNERDEWELYSKFKSYVIKSYSDIPFINHLVPNLLQNGKSSYVINSNSYLLKNHPVNNQSYILPSASLAKQRDLKDDPLTIEGTSEIADHINLYRTNKSDYEIATTTRNTSSTESNKLINVLTNADYDTSKTISSNLQTCHNENYESHPCQENSCLGNVIKTSTTTTLSTSENFNQDNFNTSEHTDVSFTTAAGKSINISNSAMLTAHRLIKDVFIDEVQQELQEKNNNLYFTKKSVTEDLSLTKSSYVMPSHGIRSFKDSEISSKNFDAAVSEIIDESFSLDSFNSSEDVSFSTAAGKTINVSNTAMQAAQKLIQDVFKEEKKPAPTAASNYGIHKNKICASSFKDIGYPLKKSVSNEMDVDMDKTLVEKFFEDTLFDEKELETTAKCNKDKNSDVVLEPNSDKNLPTRKPRKSLGGRRSMKYCSDKL